MALSALSFRKENDDIRIAKRAIKETIAETEAWRLKFNDVSEHETFKTDSIREESKKSINEIINIKEENGEILISGRELHEFLEIGTQYTKWFERMTEYGFEENQDFVLVSQKCHTNNPKNPFTTITDHALKIDMAKEIAMLQRNAKGKEARKYFIECEKKLKGQQPATPLTYKEALIALVEQVELNEKLEAENAEQQKQIEVMKPKSAYCDMVLLADGAVPITIIAKDYGMSAKAMNQLLNKYGVQYKMGGTWVLYAQHQRQGYTSSYTGVECETQFGDYAYVS